MDLPDYRHSETFGEREKLVLSFAEAMTTTPSDVDDDLRARLLGHFTPGQLTELASAIAWENQRSRLNEALGVRPAGFAEGLTCPRTDTAQARGAGPMGSDGHRHDPTEPAG